MEEDTESFRVIIMYLAADTVLEARVPLHEVETTYLDIDHRDFLYDLSKSIEALEDHEFIVIGCHAIKAKSILSVSIVPAAELDK